MPIVDDLVSLVLGDAIHRCWHSGPRRGASLEAFQLDFAGLIATNMQIALSFYATGFVLFLS